MKRLGIVLLLALFISPVFAVNEDNDLVDLIDKYVAEQNKESMKDLNADLKFDTFSSCEDMTDVLEDFVEKYADRGYYGGGYPMPMMEGDMVMRAMDDGMAVDFDEEATMGAESAANMAPTVDSQSKDYSSTNTQVAGVDEADILKTDGDYLYYFNQRLHKLSILKSPLDRGTSTIDLDDAEVITEINIPSTFYNVQLYIRGDELVILGQRWSEGRRQSFLDRNSRIDVVVYDISNINNPEIVKFSDLDGNYMDSRLIGDKLYVVSQLNANWWYPYSFIQEDEPVEIDTADLLPKSIDIAYTDNTSQQNLVIGERDLPYRVSVQRAPCEDIFYVLPNQESMEEMNIYPSFTVVRVIDIDDEAEDIETKVAIGSTQTIHMSEKGLYLTSPFYVPYNFGCPANARCILPWFHEGQHTLIHKFNVDKNRGLSYDDSSLVNGMPLSQYSMSEDSAGNFRILTKTWSPELATHFYVLDDDLDLAGMVMDIEPGEEFKSSRYIGDKLYLVTFEQTDPLFVIDIADITKPAIVGELKIPGFSTYLHPYAPMQGGVQYLLGLGYDTVLNEWGGVITNGIKLDLYKIDYNDIDDKGMVAVEQTFSEVWGERGSESESLRNPRMFVWDEKRKLLVMPMILQKDIGGENCSVELDPDGNEIARECRDSHKQETTFAGMKGITVDVANGISESFSYDYMKLLMKDKQYYGYWEGQINSWHFNNLGFRVGYLGDAMYAINNLFAHFAVVTADNLDKVVVLDETLTDGSLPPQCILNPSPEDEWCDMFCGERWIVEDGKCTEVTISGCNCPGFESESDCQEFCLE